MPPMRKTEQNGLADNKAEKAPTPYDRNSQASTSKTLDSTSTKKASNSKTNNHVIQMEQASSSETRVPPPPVMLQLNCIVGKDTSAITVKILSTENVGALKKEIRKEKENALKTIDADKLILYLVPDGGVTKKGLDKLTESSLKVLDEELQELSTYFPKNPARNLIHIIVKLPEKGPKRRFEDDEPDTSRKSPKYESQATDSLVNTILQKIDERIPIGIEEAIAMESLTQKAMVGESVYLSCLSSQERTSVLKHIGKKVGGDNKYKAIADSANALRSLSFANLDVIAAPLENSKFPVSRTKELYVREAYLKLYDEVILRLTISERNRGRKRLVVTGTAGIGKSAFLVYFAVRLLAMSNNDDPPIVVFQDRETSEVYVYGGLSVLRKGKIEEFEPFLDLQETWFLIDSAKNPLLTEARTILALSPKTLNSETSRPYQEVAKRVSNHYYMAPWTLDELKQCREKVGFFSGVLTEEFMEELYDLMGGVPRYVLEIPTTELGDHPGDFINARNAAYDRVQKAINNIKDPKKTIQHFEQARDSLEFSSRLLHRWPSTDSHKEFRLEWASVHIKDAVAEVIHDDAWKEILMKLVDDDLGTARGPMFELYVRKTLRGGGLSFQIQDLDSKEISTLDYPANPKVERFKELPDVPSEGTLCIPRSSNFACVDLLLSPNILFQATVSREHSIKGPPFQHLVKTLIEKKWVEKPEELQLIFVVPDDAGDNYPKQKFLTAAGKVFKKLHPEMKKVKQYVLIFDLKAASQGGSPEQAIPAPAVPAPAVPAP